MTSVRQEDGLVDCLALELEGPYRESVCKFASRLLTEQQLGLCSGLQLFLEDQFLLVA